MMGNNHDHPVRAVLEAREIVRGVNPTGDPAAICLPLAHLPVHSYVFVPVASPSRVYGWLALVEKEDAAVFSDEDTQLASTLGALAGMAYEKVLLRSADKKTKQKLVDAANRLLPTFVEHALWRPKERAFIGSAMRSRDIEKLKEDIEIGVRLAESLGLDVSDVQLPIP